MAEKGNLSRRQFVASAVSAAAASSLAARRGFAEVVADDNAIPQSGETPTSTPAWKDQGIEDLARSPHARLKDIPVRAVTITGGFWGPRREINVTRSIPTMHDLLEANGRMNNFRRLVGKSTAAQIGPV